MIGWVDPDTREEEKKVKSYTNGKEYVLIMSDEFGRDGRSFHDGADPMWTSMDKNDEDRGTGTQVMYINGCMNMNAPFSSLSLSLSSSSSSSSSLSSSSLSLSSLLLLLLLSLSSSYLGSRVLQ